MPTDWTGALGTWLRRCLLGVGLLLCAAAAPAQSLESVLAPGDISQAHIKSEHECKDCHVRFDRDAQDGLCISCHKDVGEDMRQRQGLHGRREGTASCRSCHAEHRGRNVQLAPVDTKKFDHRVTDFQLLDKHTTTECAKCHLPGKRWREAPGTCVACHTRDDVHKGGLGRKCEDCHSARDWKTTTFDHDKQTRFAITGKHTASKCDDCHPKARYKDTPRSCIGCHRKDDDHKGRYGEKCETCHGVDGWKPSKFRHDTDTHFVLKDKHRALKCVDCHTGPIYQQKLGTACVDCHLKDDKHKASLGTKCADCHSERSWKDPPHFDHAKARFALRGAHIKVECDSCHKDSLYRETPSRCFACHEKDDRHKANLGESCNDCHGEVDWKSARRLFDHEKTQFPLRAAHARPAVRCQDCHETLSTMRGAPTTCVSCHKRDDPHQGSLGERCDSCHGQAGWRLAAFDHAHTRFPLLGGHLVAACSACHLSQRYREAPRDCVGCHREDDKHKATLGTQCESCHNVRAWKLWTFDHDRASTFKLEGQHRQIACSACHLKAAPAGAAIAAVGSDCLSCHRKDDAHDGRFGRRCEQCHVPQRWKTVRRPTPGS
jgi:hypothetical protein